MNRIVVVTLSLGLIAASLMAQPYQRSEGCWNDGWHDRPGNGRRGGESSWGRKLVPAKISDALTAEDDALVFLAGKVSDESGTPVLSDGSGSIALDLPSDGRQQRSGTRPTTRGSNGQDFDGKSVRLMGEIDVNSDGSREIDVRWIDVDE